MDIDEEVRAYVLASKGRWQQLADKSGVSYSWLGKFARGSIPNAGVRTLRKIRKAVLEAYPPRSA